MESLSVVFRIKFHTSLINHFQIVQKIILVIKIFIFSCLVESFHSAVLLGAMWVSKKMRNTPGDYLFVKLKEIFRTIVGINSGN